VADRGARLDPLFEAVVEAHVTAVAFALEAAPGPGDADRVGADVGAAEAHAVRDEAQAAVDVGQVVDAKLRDKQVGRVDEELAVERLVALGLDPGGLVGEVGDGHHGVVFRVAQRLDEVGVVGHKGSVRGQRLVEERVGAHAAVDQPLLVLGRRRQQRRRRRRVVLRLIADQRQRLR